MQKDGCASKAELLTEEREQSMISWSFAESSAARKMLDGYCVSMTSRIGPGSF